MGGAPQTRVPFSGFDEPWRSPSARSVRPQPYERTSVAEHADDAAGVGSLRHARTATPGQRDAPGPPPPMGSNPHGNGTNARQCFP